MSTTGRTTSGMTMPRLTPLVKPTQRAVPDNVSNESDDGIGDDGAVVGHDHRVEVEFGDLAGGRTPAVRRATTASTSGHESKSAASSAADSRVSPSIVVALAGDTGASRLVRSSIESACAPPRPTVTIAPS